MKIKNKTLLFATVNFVTVKIFTFTSQSIIDAGQNSAWIMVILNTFINAFLFYIIYRLFLRSGKKDIFSIMTPFLRKTFSVLVFSYFIFTAGITLRLLIQGVIRNFMPESPSLFISSFFIIAIIYGATKGINSNLSLSLVIAPLLAFTIIVSVVMLPYYDFTNLFPILGENNFYIKSIYAFNYFSDFLIFILLMPYIENKGNFLKTGLWAIFVSGAVCLLVVLCQILSIPLEKEVFSPFYYMVTFLSGSRSPINFVKIFKLLFLFNFLLYFSTATALATYTLKRGFSIKYEKKLVGVCALLILLTEEVLQGSCVFLDVYTVFYKYSFIIFPLIPLLSYAFTKKKGIEK